SWPIGAFVVRLVLRSLLSARSRLFRTGDRTPDRTNGAFPSVNAGASENAAALRYRLSAGYVSSRPVMSPGITGSPPGTRLGRWPAPLRFVVFGVCVT